jgi:hypothetical protein
MESLSSNTQIIRMNTIRSWELVCSIMDNYITAHFLVSKEKNGENYSARCKMGDQQMAVTALISMKIHIKLL